MTIYTLALIYAILVGLIISAYVIADIDQRKCSKRENITLYNTDVECFSPDPIMNEPIKADKNKLFDYSAIVYKDTKKTLKDKGYFIYRTVIDGFYVIMKDKIEAIVRFDENDFLISVDKEWWESMSVAAQIAFLTIDK